MKIVFALLFCFTAYTAISQTRVTEKPPSIWTFTNGYYSVEWTSEASDDHFYTDTLYAIQFFPKKNDWKIYFDVHKTKVATLVHFDTLKQTITTRHYNRQGQLIKELEAYYFNPEHYNPAFPDVKNIVSIKAYRNDSLISTVQGCTTSLFYTYKNPFTKRHFEKRVYYKEATHRAEEIGETHWDYHENGVIKSICSAYTNSAFDEEGNEILTSTHTCHLFDKNGCLILDEKKKDSSNQ